MAFVNEYVSEENIKKYGLREINHQFLKGDFEYNWTVDQDREVYLRWLRSGREEFRHKQEFHLYWKGHLIHLGLERTGMAERGGKGESHWTLNSIELPHDLQNNRAEILSDLKEALSAYKTSGISSTVAEHFATFTF